MKTPPAILLRDFEKVVSSVRHLIKIVVSSALTLRWTDADKDLMFASLWWEARGPQFTEITASISGEPQTMTLSVDNVDGKISDYALANDLPGCAITVYKVALDKNLSVIGATTEADLLAYAPFVGELDKLSFPGSRAEIACVTESAKARKITPARSFSVTCPWVFPPTGDRPECAYTGAATWCDKSWATCNALANVANFGGFPWINEMAREGFYWGTKPMGWKSR